MMKVNRITMLVAVAASALAATAALAKWPTAYERTYYSDASHTVVVGHEWRGCVTWRIEGQQTPYYDELYTHSCN